MLLKMFIVVENVNKNIDHKVVYTIDTGIQTLFAFPLHKLLSSRSKGQKLPNFRFVFLTKIILALLCQPLCLQGLRILV